MSYRDILARRANPPRSYRAAMREPRRDPLTNRPVWPLQTQDWPSRQEQEKRA